MIVEAEMILIKNARVMDPESGFDQVTDILLDGKRIRQIGKVDDVSGIEQVIDASGMIAAPGLIDVHVHFRDPGFTYKEDLQTGSAAAAAGGFTTVVCMANTKPVVIFTKRSKTDVNNFRSKYGRQQLCPKDLKEKN